MNKRFNPLPAITPKPRRIQRWSPAKEFQAEIIDKRKNTLLTLKVRRTLNGISLFLKSEPLECVFQTMASGREDHSQDSRWPKISGYRLDSSHELARHLSGCNLIFNKWGERLDTGGYYNFSIVRAVGLSKGVTIEMAGPYSSAFIKEWINQLKSWTKNLYRDFLAPIDLQLTITTKEEPYARN
ncbi:MAG: hypothetical protein L0Y58_25845 [Verrucomicrobia subdivision 3 bacterium]|nr:hypothetical protein [Limisphaerales bacterium]